MLYALNREVHKHTRKELDRMIASGEKDEIYYAMISAYWHGDSYSYALELCKRLYRHEDIDIRIYVIEGLGVILLRFGRINLGVVVEVLKAAFKETDKELIGFAYEIFGEICHKRPKYKHWIKKQLQEVDLTKYDYMFASKSFIKKCLAKRTEKEQQLKFCCEEMDDAFKRKLIEYEMTTREYWINVSDNGAKDIKFCPWCGTNFKNDLITEYYDALKKECGIEIPETTNYTNIPDEFISDEWWKKRGL